MAFELDLSAAARGVIRVADFPDLATGPIRDVLRDLAAQLRAAELAAIEGGTPAGRIYGRGPQKFRGNRKGNVKGGVAIAFHRASAPGQAPASDSGGLVRSLRTALGSSRNQLRSSVVAQAFYGFMLESGTERIAARPSLVPQARSMTQQFVDRIQAVLDAAAAEASAA